jgi:L-threonylcarbamoyladenylate synthase
MTVRTTEMAQVRIFREDTGAAVVSEAARLVREGGVVALPTDSFYALGACAFDEAAVRRVCAIKGQRGQKPILLLIADRSQLDGLVASVPPAATVLMERFWPGPLTIVFPASPRIPAAVTAGTGTVGVRLPAQPLLVQLLHATGPLTGTSANRSGESPAQAALDVLCDCAVNGGRCHGHGACGAGRTDHAGGIEGRPRVRGHCSRVSR